MMAFQILIAKLLQWFLQLGSGFTDSYLNWSLIIRHGPTKEDYKFGRNVTLANAT